MLAATAVGDPVMARILTDHGADANAVGGMGYSALSAASAEGHEELVNVLLEAGADVDIPNVDGDMPLFSTVIRKGAEAVVRMLIEYGADVNHVHRIYRCTPILFAAKEGRNKAMKVLFEGGADIHFTARRGYTPLVYAVQGVNKKGAKLLLIDWGADVNVRNDRRETPLLIAVMENLHTMFMPLIKNGAMVNVKNNQGHTPWTRCVLKGNESMARMLIDNGADINVPGVLLSENSDKDRLPDVVRRIVNSSPNDMTWQLSGSQVIARLSATPLLLTTAFGHDNIATLLIGKGADVNELQDHGFYDGFVHCRNSGA